RLVDVLVQRVEVEKQRRRLDVAHDLGIEAAQLARRVDDPSVLGRVALAFPPDVEAIEIDDIYNPAQRPLREEALTAVERHDGPGDHHALRAELQSALALALYWETPTGDRAQSHELSAARRDELTAEAVETARRLDDDHALATALNARIYANWGPAMRAARPELAEELVEVAQRLGDPHLALSGRVWRVVELLETQRIDEADREIDAFEREATRIHSRLHLWTVARWRANRAFMAGDLDAAEALAAEALTLGMEIMPDEVAFHFFTTTLGPIQYLRGTLGDSFEYVRDTAAASPNVPAWRMGLATIAAQTGRTDIAQRELAALAADHFAMLPRDLNFVGTMVMCALVANNLGDADVAEAVYDHLAPYAGRLALHGTGYASYGAIDVALGQTSHAMHRVPAARQHYEVAIEACARIGSPYESIARFHLGELLADLDPAEAATQLETAQSDFSRRGLDVMAERAATSLAAIVDRTSVRLVEDADGWSLGRGGDTVSLPTLKGFRALRALVGNPGNDIHALELAALIEGHADAAPVATGTSEVSDDEARRAYESRVLELQQRLDEADQHGDAERSAALSDELDQLLAALAEAAGFGGRAATMRTDADRARVNVTKHVKRAIERIAEVDPQLGEHLRAHVSTGMTCRYQPGPSTPIRWSTR
ncbi:MAG: hypothetical protein AAFY28_14805, partial [Actinomycetota bacterium]